jgi:GTPase
LLLTKVDKAENKVDVLQKLQALEGKEFFDKIIPISSFRDINIDTLIKEIKADLKEDIAYYDRDRTHEFDDKFYCSEIIREKALFNLNEEIPHHLFVAIEELEDKGNVVFIRAEIIVDRESLKRIVVGENGSKIKIIGQKAKEELENYFGKKVFIESFVKVRKD